MDGAVFNFAFGAGLLVGGTTALVARAELVPARRGWRRAERAANVVVDLVEYREWRRAG